MSARIQIRRDISNNWVSPSSVVLAAGEFGLDTTLSQLKIGDGSTGWASLPWLGGTLPKFSPSSQDLNDASNRVQGIYRFSSAASITNGPTGSIALVADDEGVTMLVIVPASNYAIQSLWTEGNGTQPCKSYSRVYDNGTWRAWTPQSSWGVSNADGVQLAAKSLTLKDTGATALVVDGGATIASSVTINGAVTIGDANADVVTVRAGTVSVPIITTSGDTNTGIYFPAADKVAVTAGGTAQLTIDGTAAANSVSSAVFRGGISANGPISVSTTDPGTYGVKNMADGYQLADAVNIAQLFGGFRSDGGSPAEFASGESRGLIVMHYLAGTTSSIEPSASTFSPDTSDLTENGWRHKFGDTTNKAWIRPKGGIWVGLWLMFENFDLKAIKLFKRSNPCIGETNNEAAAVGNTTQHVLLMMKIGSSTI